MRKNLMTIFVILGIALVLAGISAIIFPEWLDVPGGVLILIGVAVTAVVTLGSGLNNWHDFLFGKDRPQDKDNSMISSSYNENSRSNTEASKNKQETYPENQHLGGSMSSSNLQEQSGMDVRALRQRINLLFDDSSLDALCMESFPEVHDRFSRGMRKDEKISLLLDYCRRTPERFQKLIRVIAEHSD